MSLKEQINKTLLPQHIAIIMDGNGRWAKQKGKARIFGHRSAVTAVRETIEACGELGVKYLTLYAFSTENWKRPKSEVDALMNLLVSTLGKERDRLMQNNVRLKTIGEINTLPKKVHQNLMKVIHDTSSNTGLTLILALSYSSKREILLAVKNIVQAVNKGNITPEDINEDMIAKSLYTSDFPDPELLIRTSGEYRISNFLLWQIAYTELYFTPILWPDFGKENLYQAIIDYQKRERRFGLTSEQIK